MAAAPLRALAVAGGGESSESEDDGWEIGYLDRTAQKLKGPLPVEERQETFKKALTTGNISLVEELLDSGISVDTSFQYGWTSLMYAASVSNVELVRVLLDRGANASFDKDKQTVLITACSARGSEEKILKCVELLLSRNADPNVACRRRMTPIMYAARDGRPQVAALLVARGADVNAQDENGYTEREITLRHLLTMRKDELAKNGITSRDQQKIMAALKELEVEEIKFGELPEVAKLEISGDEFLNFLLKLNKQCGHLITAVQNIITELPVNSHKIVLEWASPRNFTSVCEELVSNVEDLSEEVCKLKDLIQKLQNERENDPTHIPLMEEVSTWNSRILKRTAITVCGFGFLLFICKLTFQRK
ncbi:hypothetical protein G4228_012202 [Cervus hanglu yarkandensis]|nr:hypothetical protein G4228_012202 [Cervus hanglu yarkandensis]